MKPKNIFRIMAVMTSLLIFATSQGADKFYFGCYSGQQYPSILQDSLRFNMVKNDVEGDTDSSIVCSLANYSLRAILQATQTVGVANPGDWSWKSHYTLWEAEPYPGSYVNLQYNGGTLVNDPSASGGKAMKFSGPGEPGIIQWGPTYYQEPKYSGVDTIFYTAEFRLKYVLFTPRGAMGGTPPDTVCRLMVMNGANVLKDTTLYRINFSGSYQACKLKYTVPDPNVIDFQIYWFGITGALYIDYVKVYDENGDRLMTDTTVANGIKAYVSQSWVHTLNVEGDTVIYRWYMRDEPPSIDFYMPTRHIDSLLKTVSQERTVNQTVNRIWKPEKVFCNKRK